MTRPSTPQEAIAFFSSLPPSSIRLGLDRIKIALGALGHPEERFPSLHVAGTNGKGSTCAFADSVLRAEGRKVGLYTSPHLVRVNERIKIKGAEISDALLGQRILEVLARCPEVTSDRLSLTYFELGTVVAFWHFAQEGVDIAVVETGLGGRLDATSTAKAAVTAITPISYDHMEYLGNTLDAIASEKAGIFRPGVPAVSSRQQPEAEAALKRRADALGIPLLFEQRDFSLERAPGGWNWRGRNSFSSLQLGLRGTHQGQNAAVAIAALELLQKSGIAVSERALREGLAAARWPGRLEEVGSHPTLLLDGAHNPGGVTVLVRELEALYPQRSIHAVFGVMADKDCAPMMQQLFPHLRSVCLCPLDSPRSWAPDAYVSLARTLCPQVQVCGSVEEGLARAKANASPDDVVLCTGSLHLVGAVHAALNTSAP